MGLRSVAIVVLSCAQAVADPAKLMPAADLVGTSVDADANTSTHSYEDKILLGVPLPRWDGGGGAITFGRIASNLFDDNHGELHVRTYQTGVVGGQSLGHGLILGGGATVTYGSAVDEYTANAWQLMANGTLSWTRGKSDGFIAGAVYTSTNTFWVPLIPIIGWVHQAPESPWRFDVLLPRGVRIDYALSDTSAIGGLVDVTGGSWVTSTTMSHELVMASKVRCAMAARYQRKLFGPVRLDVRMGMMIEQYDYATPMSTDSSTRPGAYGQLGIIAGP